MLGIQKKTMVLKYPSNGFGMLIGLMKLGAIATKTRIDIRFNFAGDLSDAKTITTFIRFAVCDYDPTVGRWTTKDPIGFAGGDTNLYAYVGGNPMSYVDPSGLVAGQIGLNESVAAFFGLQGEVGVGGAVDNNSGALTGSSYASGGSSLGLQIGGGGALSLTVSPFTNNINDLAGRSLGFFVNAGFFGFQISADSKGPAFNFTVGPKQSYGIGLNQNTTTVGICNGK